MGLDSSVVVKVINLYCVVVIEDTGSIYSTYTSNLPENNDRQTDFSIFYRILGC